VDDFPGELFVRDADHGFRAGGDVGLVGKAERVDVGADNNVTAADLVFAVA
jgi:hypothetical protein